MNVNTAIANAPGPRNTFRPSSTPSRVPKSPANPPADPGADTRDFVKGEEIDLSFGDFPASSLGKPMSGGGFLFKVPEQTEESKEKYLEDEARFQVRMELTSQLLELADGPSSQKPDDDFGSDFADSFQQLSGFQGENARPSAEPSSFKTHDQTKLTPVGAGHNPTVLLSF